jgi:hypothetical protein
MTTVNLGLHFEVRQGAHASQEDTAQIYVKGTYGDGISHRCLSFHELDMEIARLKRELEALRSKARKHYANGKVLRKSA